MGSFLTDLVDYSGWTKEMVEKLKILVELMATNILFHVSHRA